MSVCYQTRDLVEAIRGDGATLDSLRVDGGMANNNWVMQRLSDVLGCEVQRPRITETTALGAACMAGLQLGLFASVDELAARWQCESSWVQTLDEDWRERHYSGWLDAVARTRSSR
jgi:glycerol kinase